MRAIALDDEPLGLDVIKTFCERTDDLQLEQTFTEPTRALVYLREHKIDLLFLDVRMPGMSGIEFYKAVGQNTMVIFTTAYSEYAVEGFNLSAIDYLLKPIQYDRFAKAVNKAREYYEYLDKQDDSKNRYLFLRIDYSLVKIDTHDIVYIEGLDNYLKIHLRAGKPLIVRMSLKAMSEQLPEERFQRVHRSYIVSVNDILSVRNKTIHTELADIPVGTNYESVVDKIINL